MYVACLVLEVYGGLKKPLTSYVHGRPSPFGTKLRTTVSDWPEDIDQYRLRRALDLTVRQQADYFLVSGGLEPHRVRSNADKLLCDCVDFANGKNCKHALAVRFAQRDQVLVSLVERLESDSTSNELDLYKLWFEGGKQ